MAYICSTKHLNNGINRKHLCAQEKYLLFFVFQLIEFHKEKQNKRDMDAIELALTYLVNPITV